MKAIKLILQGLILLILAGCAQKTKIDDATNYLLIKENFAKLNSYRDTIQANKEGLLLTTSVYDSEIKTPTLNIGNLITFLKTTDCETFNNPDEIMTCYKITRLKLIETSKELDEANYKVYLLNDSVKVLRRNLEETIDGFPKIE